MAKTNEQNVSVTAIEYGNADLKEILFCEIKELYINFLKSDLQNKQSKNYT